MASPSSGGHTSSDRNRPPPLPLGNMSRGGQMELDGQRSPIVLPPPSSLEGFRSMPPYAQPPPQRWETKSGSSSSAKPSLPSIHSLSRSSSPTTMLPTPSSIPGTMSGSTSYFPNREQERDYLAAMRDREMRAREMMAREEQMSRPSTTMRYPSSPRVKYERSLSPPMHPIHMQQHHGMPMPMPPPVDPRYYPAHAYRDRSVSDAAVQRMAAEEKEQSVGQTRRLAHLMSEQKRRESINSGFAQLRAALPTCHPTDSKAVVLRKAVSRLQQLEQMLGQDSTQHYPGKHAHASASPEAPAHSRAGPSSTERRYNDWEEKPSFEDYPRSHGRPHSHSLSHQQAPSPVRRQHSHSHSESVTQPRSSSDSPNGENKRNREGVTHWQDEPMGTRRRLS